MTTEALRNTEMNNEVNMENRIKSKTSAFIISANAKLRLRLVVSFSLVREVECGVNWYGD